MAVMVDISEDTGLILLTDQPPRLGLSLYDLFLPRSRLEGAVNELDTTTLRWKERKVLYIHGLLHSLYPLGSSHSINGHSIKRQP